MEADPKQLAAALGRVPSGLFVLSLRKGDLETGMLASWVQQCSFAPPRISIAIARQRELGALLTNETPFTLNILKEGQNDLVSTFSRGFGVQDRPFDKLDVDRTAASAPVLPGSLGFLNCVVVARHAVGDHDLVVAEVVGGKMLQDGRPWVHVRKNGLNY